MVEEVLPVVPYRQLVFTIPRRLRRFFLFERSLYGDLSRAAYAATRDYLRERVPAGFPKLRRAVPAMLVVPQSFGDLLLSHPHAHALCSLGVFLRDGSFHSMEDVDFSGLETMFRERVFSFLIEKEKITPETAESMRSWSHSGFAVDFQRKIEPGERKELEGLLTYMDRPPVSLRRLTYRPEEGLVHYQGTKLHPRLGIDHQLLPAVDFLALLVSHVLLRYEVTIRSYGALSTTFRKRVGWVDAPPVEEPPPAACLSVPSPLEPGTEAPKVPPHSPPPRASSSGGSDEENDFSKKRRRTWGKFIAKVYFDDPELCSCCGERMKIVAAITSPHQDDMIEAVLRHLNLWAPPWKRERRARAPPQSAREHESSADSIDPEPRLEDYAVDPLWDDDP
jgi:hypothetical protein